ncbi:MAG: F0F1 ATP synthase subunit delta [Gammaproteobacteria bacterium]|nr:F0F1 ATP synthase subunit delta [Gammaproteobacteria bacterium]
MASYTTIARPYAKAIFELAQAGKAYAAWSEALALLAQVVSDERVKVMLKNPNAARAQRAEILLAIIEGNVNKSIVTQVNNTLSLLAENGRLLVLPAIAESYEALRAEAESSITAIVIAAQPVESQQLTAIADALGKRLSKKVTIEQEIDPSLIGGAIIKAGDWVIDGSVKGQLTKLAQTLIR